MYVSWNWVSEFVDTRGVDPVAFADRFTLAVAEVEGVHRFGAGLHDVLITRVAAVQPHPHADKLRLALCELGDHTVTVVCGAPDLREGMWVPFVPPGVTLPSGITVRDGQVRGIDSPGMLASEADLGLSEDHDGLMELHGVQASAGTPLVEAVALIDVLYEIDNKSVTHRPDLWGHWGVAREVAALLGRPMVPPTHQVTWPTAAGPKVEVRDEGSCRRYLCAAMSGLTVKPSPIQVRLRLRSLGVRPISNVVDATNLVMLETGNPLHAFDAKALNGRAIHVRNAHADESLTTLDGEVRTLEPHDCVISFGDDPVALAGVMGGANSEIDAETTALVLEAASFDGAAVRKTAARLGMRTESSARFEKHLDPATASVAACRFVHVLRSMCPELSLESALTDVVVEIPPVTQVRTSWTYLRSRLGLSADEMSDEWMCATLEALAFGVDVAPNEQVTVTVPSFRAGRDVSIPEDLVEELGRVFGYDHIPSQAPTVAARPQALPAAKKQERTTRSALALGHGLSEVVLYSFESEAAKERLGLGERDSSGRGAHRLGLRNYLSSDMRFLRRTLVDNLIVALEANLSHGTRAAEGHKGLQIGLFEIGRVFLPRAEAIVESDRGVPVALEDVTAGPAYVHQLTATLREGLARAQAHPSALPSQPRRLAIALGQRLGGGQLGWVDVPATLTTTLYRQAVGAVEDTFRHLCLPPVVIKRAEEVAPGAAAWLGQAWLHPAKHGVIRCDGHVVGVVSALHPRVRQALDVPAEAVLVELDLDAMLSLSTRTETGDAPARFPPSSFDLTVPCELTVRAQDCIDSLSLRLGGLEGDVAVTVHWVRDFVDADQVFGRSMTLRLTCRKLSGSLTEDEIALARAATIEHLAELPGVRPSWRQELEAAS